MIKILIIEDDPCKVEAIETLLKELGIYGASAMYVNNVRDALFQLSSNVFSILILDLNLPIRSDSLKQPKENSGEIILNKLSQEQYNCPESIFGLTSYENLEEIYKGRFIKLAFNLYSFQQEDWKEALTNKINWYKKSQRQKSLLENRKTKKTVTLLVHGVMTSGLWQSTLKTKLSNEDHLVEPYEYKYFPAIKIATGFSREKQLNHFIKWLEKKLIEYPNARFNIVAHSFGTYLAIKGLEYIKLDNLQRTKNIILLGSVLPRNYDFTIVNDKFNPLNIFNECGVNDIPLIFSKSLCIGLGNAGRLGFSSNASNVKNRFFNSGHSIFDEDPDYFETYWQPFIKSNQIIDSPKISHSRTREIFESFLDLLSPKICFPSIIFLIYMFI